MISSAVTGTPPAKNKSCQFIRPIDIASAAERLALKGAGFATSNEVAAAIKGGVAAELADAVMAALGSRFDELADEDVRTLADLFIAAPSAAKTTANAVGAHGVPAPLDERESSKPLLSFKAGGDEAAGSPAASVSAAAAEKGALSSPEDDSSIDESLMGDGRTVSVELPVDDSLPAWQKFAR